MVETALYGELVLSMAWSKEPSFDDELTVVKADPRILITAEMLDEVARSDGRYATLQDDVLTIKGVNQKVIYRIGEYLLQPDCYVAEWPD